MFQAGLLPDGGKPGKSVDGAISRRAMSSGKADFLANLALFPGEAPPTLPPVFAAVLSRKRQISHTVWPLTWCALQVTVAG